MLPRTKFGIVLFSVCCLLQNVAWGQQTPPVYKAMMQNTNYNLKEVADSAAAHFEGKYKGKGSGFKPFERWKYQQKRMLAPNGDRNIDYYLPYKAYEQIKTSEQQGQRQKLFQIGGWQSLGPDEIGTITGHYAAGLGRVEYVEVNRANAQQIYIGSRSGGLWRTSDGGATWAQHTDFLPASGVNAIAASPTNFDSVLINVRVASNNTSFGIYRSADGGTTFQLTNFNPSNLGFGGLGSNFKIYVIKYHPRVPNLVFIGTDRGIFRSVDNLQTWVRSNTSWNVQDIEFHPTNNDIIYVYENYYWGTSKNHIKKSTDRGVSYTAMTDLAGNANSSINISVSPTCADCVFASSSNGIWKSVDAAANFSVQTVANAAYDLYYATPNDLDTSFWVSGYVDLYRSANSAQNFSKCSWWYLGEAVHGGTDNQTAYANSQNYVHADNNYLTCVNGIYYSCTDGFLCTSGDNGATWQRRSLSVGIRENYCIGQSQSNHYLTICGSQDNGISIKKQSGWVEAYGADGMENLIRPLNDNWMLLSTQNGGRRRTTNGGITTTGVAPTGHTSAWVAPMFFDPNDHETIYSFGLRVHKSTNFATTWVDLGTPATLGRTIEQAAIAYNNSNIIVVSGDQFIELSTDGGQTFSNIKGTLPNFYISDIAIDPRRDSNIIVTYSDYQNNNQKIFLSRDLGATWQNITYNLNNMPIESVVIDHTDSAYIYVGAAIGVYKKSINGNTWTMYNSNLPNVSIYDLEICWGSNTLKAGTWGRGLWEYSLADRQSYPAIMTTNITTPPTTATPKVSVPQFVTSTLEYSGSLSSVYVAWGINGSPLTNTIPMTLTSGNTWRSNTALPNGAAGDKIYFKVFAVGNAADTTETYKFMYTLYPFAYCDASGSTASGNLYINNFSCGDLTNSNTNNGVYTDYSNLFANLFIDSAYSIAANFNTGWAENDFHVWIDFNGDADFSSEELVAADFNTESSSFMTFTVPSTAVEDTVKMRVRLGYWGGSDDPCGTTLGEVEEYRVILKRTTPVLSVFIANFEAAPQNMYANLLQWTLAQLSPNTIVNIQRSPNGINFQTIGQLQTTNNQYNYSYTDFTPYHTSYYRLQFVEPNGDITYSAVRVVVQTQQDNIVLLTNPAQDVLQVRFDITFDTDSEYSIIDPLGHIVARGTLPAAQSALAVPISHLPTGGYIFQFDNNKKIISRRFLKI